MESPVIVDKPAEYHSGRRDDNSDHGDSGFPFDEDSGSEDVWNDLAARHPDIAARLRAGRDNTWTPRKRRNSQQPDEFSRNLNDNFQGFPFNDIPPEFRQHFPSHWGERFSPRSAQQDRHYQPQEKEVKVEKFPGNSSSPNTQEIATQTAGDEVGTSKTEERSIGLPQYGLRNTVDLGQKTPAEPGQIDAEQARNQRSMSAPPDNRPPAHQPHIQHQQMGNTQQQQQPQQQPPPQQQSMPQQQQPNVRHIPIFVEGRDEPVINKNANHTTNFSEKRGSSPQPSDREIPRSFNQPPHFSKAFGAPFKGFKQSPPPFGPQRAHQQQRQDERIPKVFHPTSSSPPPAQQQQSNPSHREHQKPETSQEQQKPPPQKQETHIADPITKIQCIQKDVLDLMYQVENFKGNGRKDKQYIYLDEMLTRNLIKLDDIDTEGKENIRQARREAIKCIQKCIAVLEAKADASTNRQNAGVDADGQNNVVDAEMKDTSSQDVKSDEAANDCGNNVNVKSKAEPMQQANGQRTENEEDLKTQSVTPQRVPSANKLQPDSAPMEVDQNASSQRQ